MIAVIAGNQREYTHWLRRQEDLHQYFYARSVEHIRGIELDEVLVVGTAADRDDFKKLYLEAKSRIRSTGDQP